MAMMVMMTVKFSTILVLDGDDEGGGIAVAGDGGDGDR